MLRYVAIDGRRNPSGQLLFGTDTSRAVVVGVDGSPDSTAALDLAAGRSTPALGSIGFTLVDEAGCPVVIVPRIY
jgi:hypothetical protein